MINNKIIGQKIRTFRKQQKFTQFDLADMLYKSQSTISQMEQGKLSIFAAELFHIADALNVNVYDFGVWDK